MIIIKNVSERQAGLHSAIQGGIGRHLAMRVQVCTAAGVAKLGGGSRQREAPLMTYLVRESRSAP